MIRGYRVANRCIASRPESWTISFPSRRVSTKSAIHQGLKRSDQRNGRPSAYSGKVAQRSLNRYSVDQQKSDPRARSQDKLWNTQQAWITSKNADVRYGRRSYESQGENAYADARTSTTQQHFPRREGTISEPLALPYTTPASVFLYGRNVVFSAMEARRRKLYNLYVYESLVRDDDFSLQRMAANLKMPVHHVSHGNLKMMDRMSEGRPHNGYVLEASPLPKFPVLGFDRTRHPGDAFSTIVDHQSREDIAINGTGSQIPCGGTRLRFPFVILLDGVLDPGNLGAIIRTAFFLGVDAIVLTNQSAPLSSTALKASAGASEAMPLVTVKQTRKFLDKCKDNGWAVFSSDADTSNGRGTRHQRHYKISSLHNPLTRQPCILLIGNEGQGLYKDIQHAADYIVHIEGQRIGEVGVDSLNVSVAAGILCEAFLREPATMQEGEQYLANKDAALKLQDRLF